MREELAAKHARLSALLEATGGALLGFSGGVDSTLLLAVGRAALGERLLAVTARGPLIPRRELAAAEGNARALGARHEFVDLAPLAIGQVAGNHRDRCFHCKRAVFGRFVELARERGLPSVLSGDNADDLLVHRPGRAALVELSVRSPLAEAGFTKAEVRELSAELGLPTAAAPTVSCLATRFPYGTRLTPGALARVDRLEEALLELLGDVQLRVRMHDHAARIEVAPERFAALLEHRGRIAELFRAEGIPHVGLDLSGFRSGSMDEEPAGEGADDGAAEGPVVRDAEGSGAPESSPDACLDHDRARRCGFPEVVYCAGKTAEQVGAIFAELSARHANVLGTRATAEQFAAVASRVPEARFNELGRVIKVHRDLAPRGRGEIAIVSAGTSDRAVLEEAVETARIMGNAVRVIQDVGVAGLHRVMAHREALEAASAVIVIAGMDGALPAVVGGLISRPVIAVPTSVGYGTSFGGVAPLLAMLNACSSGIAVVNIDNGFGGACAATRINRAAEHAGSKS